MKQFTKKQFNTLREAIREQYGLESVAELAETFSVTGPLEQRLIGAVQLQADFLQKINVITVTDKEGQTVMPTTHTITGRKKVGRHRTNIGQGAYKYKCEETDQGIIIPWAVMDTWARFGKKFMGYYAAFVQRQIALDMMMVGWFGESVAENTDPKKFPLLQDVNKGWLQYMRDNKAENVIKEITEGSGKVVIFGYKAKDSKADYANLDQLAFQMKQALGEAHRQRGDLVFLVGADLVAHEADMINKSHGMKATEVNATKQHELLGTFGGMPAATPPNFPAMGAVVTTYDNLSIYIQEASIRRKVKDDDEQKGVIDSLYSNQAYVVEDPDCFVALEFKNVEIGLEENPTA